MDALERRLAEVEAELRSIHEAAGDAALNDEQQSQWDALEDERRNGLAVIERRQRVALLADRPGGTEFGDGAGSRDRWNSVQVGAKEQPFDGRDLRILNRSELRSKAMAVLDSPEHTGHLADVRTGPSTYLDAAATQAHIERMLRTHTNNFDGEKLARLMLATESEAYRSAFMKMMARGSGAILTAEEGAAVQLVNEVRAAMSLSDAAGGYGVPVLIDPSIVLTAQGHPNDFFQISRVENITNDEWKGVSSAGATSYWTTEATTMTDGSPTLAQPNVVTKKLTTVVKHSFEIAGDYPNFASEIASLMAESQSEKLVEAFTNGLGTTAQPYGIITAIEAAAASQVAVSTDGALFANDLYKLWDALPIRYRSNARWMASTSVSNAIRQFAAGSNNSDANFTINITQAEIERLFGRPFHYNDYMDDAVGTSNVTSASDVSLVLLGDFRNFLIANRVGATVETVQHILDTTTGLPTGERATVMWRRIGSDSINDSGFRLLTQD